MVALYVDQRASFAKLAEKGALSVERAAADFIH
ncbi:protein of unknown function [Acidithiobacillus ferrivorans]|uniref:Uncharacterized protein n=1 Tax=Acidithiobacillus ferrivorans TaxID=160808 RepID=A0A060UQQ5_9PROT|nr:hypothetical protein AFERRI_430039 [Acidithiobacillus ferrivorans]SMH67401.1 protein of unknown function [Acidithiobacillus ferrivorans]